MTRPFSMLDLLLDAEPLSQVVFIHDYVQLIFQDLGLSVYNPISMRVEDNRILNRTDLGFHDKLVGLIGTRVKDQWEEDKLLFLEFESSARVVISLRPEDVSGPEAFMLTNNKGLLVVEQNA